MLQLISRNIIVTSIKQSLNLLPRPLKIRGGVITALLILNAFLEVFGLAAVIPLISLILQDDAIQTSRVLSAIYEGLSFTNETNFLFFLSGVFLVLIIVKNLASLYINFLYTKYSFDLFDNFTVRLLKYFYQRGFLYLKSRNSSEIVRDVNAAANRFASRLIIPLFVIFTEVVLLLIILVGLIWYDTKVLVLLAAIIGPFSFIFFRLVKNRLQHYNEKIHELSAELEKSLYQSIFGYVDVQINNRQNWFFDQYQQHVQKKKRIRTRLQVLELSPPKLMEVALMIGIVLIILYGVTIWQDKEKLSLTLGVLALAAFRILPSFNRIMKNLMAVRGHQYLFDVLNQLKESSDDQQNNLPLSFNQQIEFKQLTFAYPKQPDNVIISDLNLKVKKGERIGIIGRSGSGKTTFLNILLRFLEETEGGIYLDDQHITQDHLYAWRELIGYVQQEVYLIDGTLAENIAFGYDKLDLDRLAQVIKQASLEEVVAALPQGIDTQVGERGSQLSGGQRQRVGIARALYSGAQILCFDEATSALDTETEREITESINKLAQEEFTMFIIAHRLTTLKYCDRILELENGRIKSISTYQDLIPDLLTQAE